MDFLHGPPHFGARAHAEYTAVRRAVRAISTAYCISL